MQVPPPREAPGPGPRGARGERGPGPYAPYDRYGPRGTGTPPGDVPPSRKRLIRRVLTSNVTIMVVALVAIVAAVVLVDIGRFTGEDGTKPPKMAAGDLSTNEMLTRLTATDMNPVVADAVASAKQRAYEKHKREMEELKRRAKKEAEARAKLKAQQEKERLAKLNPSSAQNKAYGKKMNALKGWGRCWPSLLTLWNHESGWNERAENPSSGAYGIPQALPGSKMSSAGSDWRTSTPTQIAWGLGYIKARYKDPCGAWSFWQSHNWY
ncbi:cell envelope integrity protein TolA [Actinomadura sp. KC216]|uniref:cell envelope integrity protein TolA n=1 Tax=Actinomadura sp. KC216 TaxID=2530370 RepID=UPI001FB68B0B|nr:cell envelope integrity protein TolA [Actinomadura sp. KC216]